MITLPALAGLAERRGVRHGFFTREGGVSDGIYASLNCGFGSGDAAARVAENRARAVRRLGFAGDALTTVHQVHGRAVAVVDRPIPPGEAPRADAMVSRTPGVALGILTADCAPVLLADADAGVIGAAHAGWRGAVGGVLEAAVEAMVALGAHRPAISAAVGPCISQRSYEVGPEFPAPFLAADPANARFFVASERTGHFRFDLAGFVVQSLHQLGLGAVDSAGDDTCADDGQFFSYRRSCLRGEPDYGRSLSAIALAG